MNTFSRARPYTWLLSLCLLICLGWHLVLFNLPTDTMTGSADFRDAMYRLDTIAPPGSNFADDGMSTYRGILRVDARDVSEWLARAVLPGDEWATDWRAGDRHQYLVERRDNDGKRVVNITLELPRVENALQYARIASLVTLLNLVAAMAVTAQKTRPAIGRPLLLVACGSLLGLPWVTFGVPFSYLALRTPFLIQLALHIAGSVINIGVVAHLALTFPVPLAWYLPRRRLVQVLLYGMYPVGLLLVLIFAPTLEDKFIGMFAWEQQIAVALKAAAYLVWAAQYRRATVNQRGQMHWILMVTTAYDLVYIVGVFSGGTDLAQLQLGMGLLLPLGYMMATLPGRSLRLMLGPSSGLIHGVANTLTLALFLCGLGLAAGLLSSADNEKALPVMTMLLSAGFALTTVPLANLLREQFDSWIHGTRSAQRALLHQFTGRVSEQITLSEVTKAFFEALDQGVQPEKRALWLWNDEAQALQPVETAGTLIPVDPALYEQLLTPTGFVPSGQMRDLDAAQLYHGVMVLNASRRLVGVCAIGARVDGRNYPGDAIRFFETLTRSATLAFRNAQLVEQLEDKVAALRQSYQHIITAQESERRRLATELHDDTLQQLAHVNLLAGGLQGHVDGEAEISLKDMKVALVSTERGLREILRGVHPAVLTDLGLVPALTSWLPHPESVMVELKTEGFDGYRLPDATLELTLYRLCQESVNNALKHARATRIDLKLIRGENTVVLEVADNGAGFEPAALASKYRAENGHFGLTNLRERVNALNGQLVIQSKLNHGTLIRAVLPLHLTPTPGASGEDDDDGE